LQIILKSTVKGNFKAVIARFDRNLFEALKPKGAKMEIVEFTGSRKGNKVHIRFVWPFKANWISDIIADGSNDKEAFFIDEGRVIPFGIKFWQHKHVVRFITNNTCEIIDDINYRGVNKLWTLLLYPALYIGFYPRKNIYKKYFGSID
jgi:ligand-binding SRPBCC domain-containing protein